MNKNVQAMFDTTAKIENGELELKFRGGNVNITWDNLQVDCSAKNFDRVFAAIKVLAENGAYFK